MLSTDRVSLKRGDASASSRDVRPRTQVAADRDEDVASQMETNQQIRSASVSQNFVHDRVQSCRFHGKPLSDFLIIEIFAGTARLSITAREAGFRSLSVDKTSERCKGAHIAIFDLSQDADVARLMDVISAEKDNIAWIHFAPACGTASRAREKRLPRLESAGIAVPQPLRSEDFPCGFPNLKGLDATRVKAANAVYINTCKLIRHAYSFDLCCSIENPDNSLFWWFPDVVTLIQDLGGFFVVFHNCCHGGLRQKLTKIWATHDWFESLHAICQNDHYHLDWKPVFDPAKASTVKFPTSSEAAYPFLLCKRFVDAVRKVLLDNGAQDIVSLVQQVELQDTTAHSFLLGALPRGKKFKPLVSEYSHYFQCVLAPNNLGGIDDMVKLFPKGAKPLHRRFSKWGEVRVDDRSKMKLHKELSSRKLEDSSQVEIVDVGIPREPLDFCKRAIEVGHPRSVAIHLSELVKDTLYQNFEAEPHHVAKLRAHFFLKWTKRAHELAKDEVEFQMQAPVHLRSLLRGKRLLLLKEI